MLFKFSWRLTGFRESSPKELPLGVSNQLFFIQLLSLFRYKEGRSPVHCTLQMEGSAGTSLTPWAALGMGKSSFALQEFPCLWHFPPSGLQLLLLILPHSQHKWNKCSYLFQSCSSTKSSIPSAQHGGISYPDLFPPKCFFLGLVGDSTGLRFVGITTDDASSKDQTDSEQFSLHQKLGSKSRGVESTVSGCVSAGGGRRG